MNKRQIRSKLQDIVVIFVLLGMILYYYGSPILTYYYGIPSCSFSDAKIIWSEYKELCEYD